MKIVKNFKINGKNIIIREVKTEMKNEPYLCGYVEITKDNKYYDKHYDGLDPTFSGIIPFDCFENKYYIGFDCSYDFMNPKEYNLENIEKVCKELYDFIYEGDEK